MIEVTGSDCRACGSTAGDCYSVLCMGDVLCCDRCDGHDGEAA